MKGYIHVYTGNGKGKTTAAFGVALRSLLNDKKVYVGQFIKGMKYSETAIENYFDTIKIEQFGDGCFINRKPSEEDKIMAENGLSKIKSILTSSEYDLVILDELTIALYFKLISLKDVIDILKSKREEVEVIITGRFCPQELIDLADLVTDMTEVKHYYTQGVLSRKGIDC